MNTLRKWWSFFIPYEVHQHLPVDKPPHSKTETIFSALQLLYVYKTTRADLTFSPKQSLLIKQTLVTVTLFSYTEYRDPLTLINLSFWERGYALQEVRRSRRQMHLLGLSNKVAVANLKTKMH